VPLHLRFGREACCARRLARRAATTLWSTRALAAVRGLAAALRAMKLAPIARAAVAVASI